MRDFYSTTAATPLDQADGLRRLFAGARRRYLPLVANPHVAFSGVVLERISAGLVALGQPVLVVDAAANAPAPQEMALLDLSACIEPLSPEISYLAARGLPLAHVDTRGSASGFLDAIEQAAPQAEVVLLHASAGDLARLFQRRAVRPLLMGADRPESIKHAYGSCKLLAQRCGLMTFDLLLTAEPGNRRMASIASTLASCADSFLGAVLHDWTAIDPGADVADPPHAKLLRMLSAQTALDDSPPHAAMQRPPGRRVAAAALNTY